MPKYVSPSITQYFVSFLRFNYAASIVYYILNVHCDYEQIAAYVLFRAQGFAFLCRINGCMYMWKKDMRHEFVTIWQCHNVFWNELTMGHKEANKNCQRQQFQHDLLDFFFSPNLVHEE